MVTKDQGASAEDRKERKKENNRRNQRARRERMKSQEDVSAGPSKRPFRIHRWRAIENATLVQSSERNTLSRQFLPHQADTEERRVPGRAPIDRALESADTYYEIHLPADHELISLIAYNVCRAIISNKQALSRVAIFISVGGILMPPLPTEGTSECGIAVVRPADSNLPPCLLPTQLQMNSPHPTWMDVFPFPKMRDNLIQSQYSFDHKSFFRDLVGAASSLEPPCMRPGQEITMRMSSPWREHSNTAIFFGNGLILWGEPHLMESWEVTPQFFAKWEWVFEGCREIVEVSNIWRITRGENLLADALQQSFFTL